MRVLREAKTMVFIEQYHRQETQPEKGGLYIFTCVDCEKRAEVFSLEKDKEKNKYLSSGLCPRCFEVAVDANLRRGSEVKQVERAADQVDSSDPGGITISVGRAARVLNTSSSTLKRRAAEWGIPVFWDRRGRRYRIADLNMARDGLLVGPAPVPTTMDLESLTRYARDGGYRFRAYRTGVDQGYLGYLAAKDHDHAVSLLRSRYGFGTYYLKLLDKNDRMTSRNFSVVILDPDAKSESER